MILLLSTLLGVALVCATLPLVLELALVTSANLMPARKTLTGGAALGHSASAAEHPEAGPATDPGKDGVKLTIVVPAHNEELLVERCVRSLRAAAGQMARIVVVAHNCADATAARAARAGAEALVYDDAAARGKGFALRHGFAHAFAQGAEAVMVVDADSTVSPNAVSAVRSAIASGARAMQCRYQMESTTNRSSTRLAALAFRGFNVVRPRGRERLGFSAGILGNGFALVRPVLETIPYDAFSVVEDLEYHLHLVMAGERVRYLDDAVISADFPESRSGEAQQRSRWEGGRLRTAREWTLPLAGQVMRGRWRLLEPMLDLTGLPLAYGMFLLLVAACLPVAWLRWYAGLSLAVVAAHILTTAWAGPDFLKTLQLLALAPFYILRKLWMIPGVLRGSSAKAAWVRTERDNTL